MHATLNHPPFDVATIPAEDDPLSTLMSKRDRRDISTKGAGAQPSRDSDRGGPPEEYRPEVAQIDGARSEDVAEDAINPSHYRKHPSGIECIEVTRHMNFNVGNAIKYLWRYMDKGDPVENLKKAQWYIDDEIRRLEGKR